MTGFVLVISSVVLMVVLMVMVVLIVVVVLIGRVLGTHGVPSFWGRPKRRKAKPTHRDIQTTGRHPPRERLRKRAWFSALQAEGFRHQTANALVANAASVHHH